MSTTSPQIETHAFQAEIKQLLDIVIHSLYTDREIFVRELISNASDALEKFRHETLTNPELPGKDDALAVTLDFDAEAKSVTFRDNGIGMTREELSQNLGTIASSGTRRYLAQALQAAKGDVNLIGQFGVGFYSAFMVAKKVVVETRSFHADSQGWRWESAGDGSYTIAPAEGLERGTRITLELKDDAQEFASDWQLKQIIRKFSSFVPFPVHLKDEKINTVQAIWKRSRTEVTDEEYDEFFKFIANESESARYRLHFSADAPLAINALLFVPNDHMERLGFGRIDPGVDLYCKKILIQKHPENLLPDWMRFVKGVVDSDDLPLNISRETMQDSALIRKLGKVIVTRFIKHLAEEAKSDAEKYESFFAKFGHFIKEGVASDYSHREDLAKLLRFETSKTEAGKVTSLADYIARMPETQKAIYYINGPSREAIEAGPYVEALRDRDFEVIYNLEQIDDFVFDNLGEFEGKKLLSADRGDLDLPPLDKKQENELSKEAMEALSGWLKAHYGDRVAAVRGSTRLTDNPAIATSDNTMTATMQRLMSAMKQDMGGVGKMTLEINPGHGLIRQIETLRTSNEAFAKEVADQLLDNALLAAGLLSDPRAMVARLNKLLAKAAGA
ncbi:molecular chaperone HtpG [bacterium]|nr:molecular chaperone HtpG [bacterium]